MRSLHLWEAELRRGRMWWWPWARWSMGEQGSKGSQVRALKGHSSYRPSGSGWRWGANAPASLLAVTVEESLWGGPQEGAWNQGAMHPGIESCHLGSSLPFGWPQYDAALKPPGGRLEWERSVHSVPRLPPMGSWMITSPALELRGFSPSGVGPPGVAGRQKRVFGVWKTWIQVSAWVSQELCDFGW